MDCNIQTLSVYLSSKVVGYLLLVAVTKQPSSGILPHKVYKLLHIPGNDLFDVCCILHCIASKYLRIFDKLLLPSHFLSS